MVQRQGVRVDKSKEIVWTPVRFSFSKAQWVLFQQFYKFSFTSS